jgi:hypothetical protein
VVSVRITGLREVRRALRALPPQATTELKDGTLELANRLVPLIKAAGAARGRQTERASRTTKVVKGAGGGVLPRIEAGGTKKAREVLFGTEFGATRKFGWYDAKRNPRYYNSRGKQFPPHLGRGSYWFHKTVDESRGVIDAEAADMGSNLIRRWSA